LVFVGGADGFDQFFFLFLVDFLAFPFELFQFYFTRVLAAASPLMTAKRAVGQASMKRGRKLCRTWRNFPAEAAAANYGYLRTTLFATRLPFLRRRMMPLHSASLPTMKPFTSCRKTRGMRLVAIENEARRFFRGLV